MTLRLMYRALVLRLPRHEGLANRLTTDYRLVVWRSLLAPGRAGVVSGDDAVVGFCRVDPRIKTEPAGAAVAAVAGRRVVLDPVRNRVVPTRVAGDRREDRQRVSAAVDTAGIARIGAYRVRIGGCWIQKMRHQQRISRSDEAAQKRGVIGWRGHDAAGRDRREKTQLQIHAFCRER